MSLTKRPFSGTTFFSDIRAEMAKNRGMFAGRDGDLCYACMDASFYRMTIFKKTEIGWFTTEAKKAPGRVVVNGQWFSALGSWKGEIFVNGVREAPEPSNYGNNFWYFGQHVGRSQQAFVIGQGMPSTLPPSKWPHDGLYPVNALVIAKKKPALGVWEAWPASLGKIVYGVHRASDIVFVVAQKNETTGITAPALATRLVDMGVDDAALGDGSDSATLVVDGEVEVDPGWGKDTAMPVGPMFTLQTLKTKHAASKLSAAQESTDSKFGPGTVLLGVSAQLLQANSGMQMQALSWGATGTRTAAQIRLDLELPNVTTLACPGSRLTGATASSFAIFTGPSTTASLRLDPAADSGGRIVGTVTVKTSRGKAVFNVDWALAP